MKKSIVLLAAAMAGSAASAADRPPAPGLEFAFEELVTLAPGSKPIDLFGAPA